MRGMNSSSVDMIYLDPPFNSKKNYGNPTGGDGKFKDKWTLDDFDIAEHGLLADESPAAYAVIEAAKYTQGKATMAYLIFMAVRLLQMKRIMKPKTGQIFLHCDDAAAAYLKALMDAIFGKREYRNTIIWKRTSSHNDAKRTFGRTSDYIFHYAMPNAKFNPIYDEENEEYVKKFKNPDNDPRGPYTLDNLANPHHGGYDYEWKGYQPPEKGWRCPENTMQDYHDSGILHYPVNDDGKPEYDKRIRKKRYLRDYKGAVMGNVWTDIRPLQDGDPEFMKYPTQKPPELMHRIIACSTEEGDLVFDPFCGCASTLVAAEDLQRKWAGCDISDLAVELLIKRIHERKDLVRLDEITSLKSPSVRDDCKKLPHYRTHRQELYGRQRGCCNGCFHHFPYTGLTVDHIQPKSRSGQDNIENLQLLCSGCNSSKKDKTMAEWISWRRVNEPATYKRAEQRRADGETEWQRIPV